MTNDAPRKDEMAEQRVPATGRLRRQLRRLRPTRSLVGRIDGRVDRTMRQQEKLRAQLERQGKQLESLKATIATMTERQGKQLESLKATIATMRERAAPLEQEAKTRMVQHSRMSVQLGALEERLGRLDEQLATGPVAGDDAARAEARSILDAVRREHEQVRVRLQIISHYEERLRRVEAAVESIAEGDVRRMV